MDEERDITDITITTVPAEAARAFGHELPADDPEPEGLEPFELPPDTWLN